MKVWLKSWAIFEVKLKIKQKERKMSKAKLRRKIRPFHNITYFDCEKNSIYARAICNYELIKTFKIHKLWIRHIDANTSCLVCEWNRDERVIHDLAPFWDIYDLINEGKDTNTTLTNLINKLESEYKYSVPRFHKDKYKEYLKLNKRKRFEEI